MTPDTKITTKNQHLVTLLLILLLVVIVAGYIYYGMTIAQQADPGVGEFVEEPVVASDNDQRQQIIDALNQQAPATGGEERNVIVDSLRASSNQPNTDEEENRAAILEALQKN